MKQEQGVPRVELKVYNGCETSVLRTHPVAQAESRVVQFRDGVAAPQRQQEACCFFLLRHTLPLTPALVATVVMVTARASYIADGSGCFRYTWSF